MTIEIVVKSIITVGVLIYVFWVADLIISDYKTRSKR